MKRQVALFSVAIVLAATIWIAPSHLLRYVAAFPLLWLLPGLSWISLIPSDVLDRAERLVVGLGLNFVVTPTICLLVAYLPGPVTRTALTTTSLGAVGLPAALSALAHVKRGHAIGAQVQDTHAGFRDSGRAKHRASLLNAQHPLWRDGWAWLLVAVLIAGGLRVVNLSYAEFQGDEAKVMVRAARALEGDEAVVFQHKKAPAQLTVVMPGWRLAGITNEWMARLPFAWVSILGVAAVFLCGRRLGRPHAGGIAACLLATEGYHVGFGRIVQYQSLVFALGTLALLCLLVYCASGRGSLAALGAILFAGGSLAHYDVVLALPAGLFLVGARLWLDRRRGWRALVPVVCAALVGIVLTGAFYLPFLRSPYVGDASGYVAGRIGGGFHNNLWSAFELSAVYDAVYLLALTGIGLVGRTLVAWARWGWLGLVLSIGLLVAAITGLLWPQWWDVDHSTMAWIPHAVLLTGALLSPGQPAGTRAAWLWLGFPTLFYLFFVATPLTHVYTAFPACAVLAGLGLTGALRWLAGRSRGALGAFGAVGLALYGLCTAYAIMLFVDHTPEYRRTFPQFRSPIYWTPYDQMPSAGLFGFPYRAGWKVVGYLMDQGKLVGSYASNEKWKVTNYYTRQALRLDCACPDVYITAVNVQDEVSVPWGQIEAQYQPVVVVTVRGQPKLTVHKRDAHGEHEVYRTEEYGWAFDLGSTPDRVAASALDLMARTTPGGYIPREATIGGFARLVGYTIDTANAVPGGYVGLTLVWQGLESPSLDYHVFTHLYDGETMRGQWDGQPVCGSLPTSHWEPGQFVVDPYRIPINEHAQPGAVPLTVGMYNLRTMERLSVSTPDEATIGDTVHLTNVEIRSP